MLGKISYGSVLGLSLLLFGGSKASDRLCLRIREQKLLCLFLFGGSKASDRLCLRIHERKLKSGLPHF